MATSVEKDLLIVTPYRNREEHLKGFLENSPKYFKETGLTYDILICELDQGGDWNAGLPCNSLSTFLNSERKYKYLYIHHVDVWPIEGEWKFPEDKEVYHNLGDYGSCLMKMETFFEVNGYSNSFWGWGGEDNDLYQKLRCKGYNVIDIAHDNSYPVKYNTDFQNHERKFNGANYGNGLKNLFVLTDEEKNSIFDFNEHAIVKDLCILDEENNIYRQIVTPLHKSSRETVKDKVLIGFIKAHTKFDDVAAFVKSAMVMAGYDFDVWVIVGDEEPDGYFMDQIEVHGAKVFRPKTVTDNLYIERYECYKEFLQEHPQYKTVLHTDVTDVYFLKDPFKQLVKSDKLFMPVEGIKIKDESWNSKALYNVYGPGIVEEIGENEVICSGVMGGPRELFEELIDKLIEEHRRVKSNHNGVDQVYLLKLIYKDKILQDKIEFKSISDSFCINLHVCVYNPETYDSKYKKTENGLVMNADGEKYCIVHQYNRLPDLYNRIYHHFTGSFYPI